MTTRLLKQARLVALLWLIEVDKSWRRTLERWAEKAKERDNDTDS